MRIKRFTAPDMRTALRMVRDEQGPDAVILSNRPTPDGIEIVAATDYDEALVQQALRAAAPGLAETAPVATTPATPAAPTPQPAVRPAPVAVAAGASRAEAMIAALAAAPARDSESARARAMFRVGQPAVEATATRPAAAPAPRATPALASLLNARADAASECGPEDFATIARATTPAAPAKATAPGDDFRALLARLTADEDGEVVELSMRAAVPSAHDDAKGAATREDARVQPDVVRVSEAHPSAITPAHDDAQRPAVREDTRMQADVARVSEAHPGCDAPAPGAACGLTRATESAPATAPATPAVAPVLRAVPAEDPALVAMRAELSMMRELIERQMDQYAIERLRGSAGRAWAFDTLVGYGCDESLAQSVASRIDAQLSPDEARAPMVAELSRLIVTNRAEPIDDGGVIALVGPTGAGKTTTVAKLAARFAARHRARDVALVTTDIERAGAREQLHAHGRRLGITVCEAEGPEGLNRTLEQLADYPLVLVDTAGYAARDRALLGQILWLRTARRVRSLLVLPANANPHDLAEVVRRYRPASPEGVVLTKTDETGRLGAALSVLVKQDLSLAYTSGGQQVPTDLETADPARLVAALEQLRRAADNPLATEDRHAVA